MRRIAKSRKAVRTHGEEGGPESRFDFLLKAGEVAKVCIAPHSPRQSPDVERLIGSIRRDLLDHAIVFNERHLL